jgi:DNA polymerase-1
MAGERPMFYIVDGHAVAYRNYFGLPVAGFSTKEGEPTNATYGFTRVLLDILLKYRPKYLAVSFDMGLSGRDELFEEYKGTREKMPDDLRLQMERIQQMVEAFNIPVLAIEGYEADDIIGTVAKQAEEQGIHVRVITGDRDLLQLLTDNVTVELPSHGRGQPDIVYDIPAFIEKYTVRPDQFVDWKALVGDSSDNIPGVAGIGQKTATSLLLEFETLNGIYESIELLKGSTKQKLIDGRELAYLSQELATIQRDAPITLALDACVAHDYDSEIVLELFRTLEFRGFADRLMESLTPTTQSMFESDDFGAGSDEDFAPPPKVEGLVETIVVYDQTGLDALVETLNNAAAITWDVETTSVDQMQAELVGIALATNGDIGYYVPVGHQSGKQLPLKTVIDALRPPLTNPNVPKYAHNAAYDMVVMQRYGIEVAPVTFDTMIAEWLRDPISKHLGLKNLALHELSVYMTPIKELIGTGKKQKTMDMVAVQDAAPYAAADAAITHRLVERLNDDLVKQGLDTLYQTLEIPLVPVISAMEQVGVVLDVAFLRDMSKRLDKQLEDLTQEIYGLSGGYGEFNINSPKQLNDVLFGKLGLSVSGLKKTTHGYSTDAGTLEQLKQDTEHPIIIHILDYRELSKLKSTYVDALPELVNPHTGRVHTSYNQTGTATGRISSNSPNLQNIPIRTEIGREVRRAFVAPRGSVLLAVDYSQIELRVLAHVSQDATLLRAFEEGQDIHAATAAAVNNIPVEDVTYEQRSFAKRVNFGLIYGMGAFRLARESDLTLAEAQAFIERYFERLPRVLEYIENTKRQARLPEGVSTLFGRKRYFSALMNADGKVNRQVMEGELRAAVNMPIQGTAADIMKRAMIDLHNELQRRKLNAKMILQVHDELVLEVAEDLLPETRDLVVTVMESAYKLDAPLKANAQVGTNWRDMQDA